MHPLHRTLPLLLLAVLAGRAVAQDPPPEDPRRRSETLPDGSTRSWSVDDEGLHHGRLEQLGADGRRLLVANYAHGKLDGELRQWSPAGRLLLVDHYKSDLLHGRAERYDEAGRLLSAGNHVDGRRSGTWVETDPASERQRTAGYRDGVLHGKLKISVKQKVLTRQTWHDGELLELDDLKPFPVSRATLLAKLRATLDAPPPAADPADPKAAERHRALRRLMTYRQLCGVPFAELTLVPEWNLRCDAAAEVCRRLGRLDHRPPMPDGMDPERFALGYDGASHSNLAAGGGMVSSVDQYMDDGDPSNIDRVGHRRWCLNPAMRKTGFGGDEGYSAMWSMDASGAGVKGMTAVCYPPPGFVPVDLFGARRAFSISLLRGGLSGKAEVVARITALDADYLPTGTPLELDWCDVAGGGFGGTPCVVFRAAALQVEVGRRYLVEVSTDAGKTMTHRYVVEFCEPVQAPAATVDDR